MPSGDRHIVEFVKAASIAGVKTTIDVAMRNSRRAALSFQWLTEDRFYIFLLFALTRIGTVGCKAGSAHRAWASLPSKDFIRSIRINWRHPSDGVVLSENRDGPGILHISRNYYTSPPDEGRLFAPYYAHPAFYKSGLYNTVARMRGQERNVRIFFAGGSNAAYCNRFAFPILTRDKILSHVIDRFQKDVTIKRSEGERSRLLILISNGEGDHKLSFEQYMDVMCGSDFYISPPGWLMPHSHNMIEAMSVGAIPITNYHAYMRPPLIPEVNCLAFSTVDELEKIVERSLRMPATEIGRLREGVLSYYERYLEPASFATKLVAALPRISELVVNDELGR